LSGDAHTVYLTNSQAQRYSKARQSGKSLTLKFSKTQLKKNVMAGSGLFDFVKDIAKDGAKDLLKQGVNLASKEGAKLLQGKIAGLGFFDDLVSSAKSAGKSLAKDLAQKGLEKGVEYGSNKLKDVVSKKISGLGMRGRGKGKMTILPVPIKPDDRVVVRPNALDMSIHYPKPTATTVQGGFLGLDRVFKPVKQILDVTPVGIFRQHVIDNAKNDLAGVASGDVNALDLLAKYKGMKGSGRPRGRPRKSTTGGSFLLSGK
jgi:hypothetical protein